MAWAISFRSILSTVHVARANIAMQSLTWELPRADHRFYVNRFFRETRVKRKRLHEQ